MFSCTFTIIQIRTILALYPVPNSMKLSGKYFSCPPTDIDVTNFVEKYPKIKYTIFDRPPNLAMDLCEESFKLMNGRHRNLKILNGQKI
jgi:hypothetical protein